VINEKRAAARRIAATAALPKSEVPLEPTAKERRILVRRRPPKSDAAAAALPNGSKGTGAAAALGT